MIDDIETEGRLKKGGKGKSVVQPRGEAPQVMARISKHGGGRFDDGDVESDDINNHEDCWDGEPI